MRVYVCQCVSVCVSVCVFYVCLRVSACVGVPVSCLCVGVSGCVSACLSVYLRVYTLGLYFEVQHTLLGTGRVSREWMPSSIVRLP